RPCLRARCTRSFIASDDERDAVGEQRRPRFWRKLGQAREHDDVAGGFADVFGKGLHACDVHCTIAFGA
ncbi:hypothetical protein ACP3W2_27095, partial [Salmonella enterica]|uniref:hypothetical protein n=1 Tax=Salmonella enterica TaxID=28901 RepID=UPI003CE8EFA6